MSKVQRPRGQGLVEFALILPALLLIVLSIIEGALLFQSYLAIQHAAREAARYAVTYQPPLEYSVDQGKLLLQGIEPGTPAFKNESEAAWYARRLSLIKQRALDQAMGIRTVYPALDETSFAGLNTRPGFFGVRVWGFPSFDRPEQIDHPGLQGLPVRVLIFEEGAAYYLCSDRSSKASLQACAQAQVSGDDSAGFRVFEMDGRLVASSRLSLATIGRPDFCPAHEDLLGVHGWCSSDHLVLLSREYFRRERRVESSCRERSLSDRCVVVAVSPDLALYRCPSRGDCVAPGG